MNKILIATLVSAGFVSMSSAADFTDYANVKRVEPQYSSVNSPTQRCTTQTIQETIPGRSDRTYGGAVVGGLAGGLLGNQIGGGSGKQAATAVGAVVGALTGDNIDNRNNYIPPQTTTRDVQRCYTEDNYSKRITNYKVTYEYKGKVDTFYTQEEPVGKRIRVNVSVTPYGEDNRDGYKNRDNYRDSNNYRTPDYPAYVR